MRSSGEIDSLVDEVKRRGTEGIFYRFEEYDLMSVIEVYEKVYDEFEEN